MPEWGLPPFAPSTSAIGVYPVGTIIMDITVPGRDTIVWRGAARREVNFETSDAKRREVIERAIRDLFKSFPPEEVAPTIFRTWPTASDWPRARRQATSTPWAMN